jgi:hypothetical protein
MSCMQFEGHLDISPAMKPEHVAFINRFSKTRRMARNETMTEKRPDPFRIAVQLPLGPEGGYFVGEEGSFGQGKQLGVWPEDVVDYNRPPMGQPGLWCQWIVSFKNSWGHESADASIPQEMVLEWDQNEKFKFHVEWLKYLIKHFFEPWGYVLNGEIECEDKEYNVFSVIKVKNNLVKVYEEP